MEAEEPETKKSKIVFFIQLAPLLGYNKYHFVFIK